MSLQALHGVLKLARLPDKLARSLEDALGIYLPELSSNLNLTSYNVLKLKILDCLMKMLSFLLFCFQIQSYRAGLEHL